MSDTAQLVNDVSRSARYTHWRTPVVAVRQNITITNKDTHTSLGQAVGSSLAKSNCLRSDAPDLKRRRHEAANRHRDHAPEELSQPRDEGESGGGSLKRHMAKAAREAIIESRAGRMLGKAAMHHDLANIPRLPDDFVVGINQDEKHSRHSYLHVYNMATDAARQHLPKGADVAGVQFVISGKDPMTGAVRHTVLGPEIAGENDFMDLLDASPEDFQQKHATAPAAIEVFKVKANEAQKNADQRANRDTLYLSNEYSLPEVLQAGRPIHQERKAQSSYGPPVPQKPQDDRCATLPAASTPSDWSQQAARGRSAIPRATDMRRRLLPAVHEVPSASSEEGFDLQDLSYTWRDALDATAAKQNSAISSQTPVDGRFSDGSLSRTASAAKRRSNRNTSIYRTKSETKRALSGDPADSSRQSSRGSFNWEDEKTAESSQNQSIISMSSTVSSSTVPDVAVSHASAAKYVPPHACGARREAEVAKTLAALEADASVAVNTGIAISTSAIAEQSSTRTFSQYRRDRRTARKDLADNTLKYFASEGGIAQSAYTYSASASTSTSTVPEVVISEAAGECALASGVKSSGLKTTTSDRGRRIADRTRQQKGGKKRGPKVFAYQAFRPTGAEYERRKDWRGRDTRG